MINFSELPSDGISFEQLIREILIRSSFEVHWTGVGPDGGRDLVVTETANGQLAAFKRKWLVSCKHYANSGRSVCLDDITDITDACEAAGATGFLLACSTQPSSSVVKRFEEIESRGRIVIRYWDSVEIEKRLNTPATLPLIHLFFPETAKRVGWKVYNTDSPSFWAANYQDYFIYLSSRTANSFPNLKDVEKIIRKLESIELPEGTEWNRHFIRPRAVYFDNKHEQFTVFADYLYPEDDKKSVVLPRQVDKFLQDGMGLYLDDEAMRYITHWDIRYVSCLQISDHFHLDRKDYYEPFIDRFKIGSARGKYIGEMY